MRWKAQIKIACDGCGAEADAVQEHAQFGQGGGAQRIHHPDGWTGGQALPGDAVLVDARGQAQVDPFGPVSKIATAMNAPVPVMRCPMCTAQNQEAGDRARKLLGEMDARREVGP